MSGQQLLGREVFIDFAENKPQRNSFGGGDRGAGGFGERTPRPQG